MEYIDHFRKHVLKKAGQSSVYLLEDNVSGLIRPGFDFDLPMSVKEYYRKIDYVSIKGTRPFEMFPLKEVYLTDTNYLVFSRINHDLVCFDTSHLNSANEWDIICKSNGYLITKTLASYLSNKVWAWVDRGREVWKEEFPLA